MPEEPHAVVVPRVAYHDGVDLASAAVGLDHDGEFPSLLDVELVAQFGGHVHDGDPAFEFAVGDEFVGHCQEYSVDSVVVSGRCAILGGLYVGQVSSRE